MKPDKLAIVQLTAWSPPMFRPAAFLFQTTEGITWIEPSYADPYGSPRPSQHAVDGTLEEMPSGVLHVTDGDKVVAIVEPMGLDAADDDEGSCTWALVNFIEYLANKNTTAEAERQAVAIDAGITEPD